MSIVHEIGKGSTLTPLYAVLKQKNASGVLEVVNLTGKAVRFTMYDEDGNAIVADGAASIEAAADGTVSYDFAAADVDEAGTFFGRFLVYDSYPGGEADKFPPDPDDLQIIVHGPVDTAETQSISSNDLLELAKAPKKTVTDEGSVEERPIDELIKADKYNKANTIGDSPLHGLRISLFKPGGPV